MSFEQEKMIVGSLPSLYPLQKFEEEAINTLVSLPIDDDVISRKAAIELCDWYDNPSMREDLEKLRPVRFSTDTISRKAAIDAVEFGITYAKAINKETGEVTVLFEEINALYEKADDETRGFQFCWRSEAYTKLDEMIKAMPQESFM